MLLQMVKRVDTCYGQTYLKIVLNTKYRVNTIRLNRRSHHVTRCKDIRYCPRERVFVCLY